MIDNLRRVQITINRIHLLAGALESLSDDLLEKPPKLFSLMAEAPMEDIRRMLAEVEELFVELRQIPVATVS